MTRASTWPATVAADPRAARYSTVAIVLHWAIAALLFAEVALGLRMTDAHGSARFAIFQLHKSIGITILLLVAARLLWRLYRRPPPVGAHGWERGLAHAVHTLFYVLLFALPLSGWIIISTSRIVVPTLLYGTIPWPHFPGTTALATGARHMWNTAAIFTHVNLVTVAYVLVALHVAGALKHQWLDRDGDIARMAPGVRPGRWVDPRLALIALGAAGAIAVATWLPIGRPGGPVPPTPTGAAATPTGGAAASTPAVPIASPAVATIAATSVTPAVAADDTAATTPVAAVPPAAAAAPAAVATWAIQPASTLHWRTTWSGETIDGGFTRFDGDIAFDPDRLDASHVTITVDTTSVFSGDAQRDGTLTSADWFATGAHPVATFTATHFRRTAPGHYLAAGRLSLKGVTLPVPVAFTLTIAGDTATMRGTATIDRTAFKIGEGDYAATTDIPAAVALDIAVTARRK